MLKKSVKYLIIASLNLAVLTLLLALWTDELELTFHDRVRIIEFLKIIGFTFLSLIAMRILIYYAHKRNYKDFKSRIKISALVTCLVSSYLYADYTAKIVSNRIVKGRLRDNISSKIIAANGMANGTKADSLNIVEYQEILNIKPFPKVPDQATSISYLYEYDDFLPDYLFEVKYDLPIKIKVDTIHFEKGDFMRSQTVAIVNNRQRVTYCESTQ